MLLYFHYHSDPNYSTHFLYLSVMRPGDFFVVFIDYNKSFIVTLSGCGI